MTRKVKALGWALMAALALSAGIGASSAAAANFKAEKAPTILTGTNASENIHVFKMVGAEVSCVGATLTGTMSATSNAKISLRPTFTNCEMFEEVATMDTTGCTLVLESETNGSGHLPVEVSCTPNFEIKVTTSSCNLGIPSQKTTAGVKATNFGTGASRDITLDATVATSFKKIGGPLCFLITGAVGSYSGPTTLRAYEEGSITGDIHDMYSVTEKAQVGLWWE